MRYQLAGDTDWPRVTKPVQLRFHRTRDAIEAHLTVVFTALGVARFMQDATGASLKKIITTLRPLREFTGVIGDQEITFAPDIPSAARELLDALPLTSTTEW